MDPQDYIAEADRVIQDTQSWIGLINLRINRLDEEMRRPNYCSILGHNNHLPNQRDTILRGAQ